MIGRFWDRLIGSRYKQTPDVPDRGECQDRAACESARQNLLAGKLHAIQSELQVLNDEADVIAQKRDRDESRRRH